MTISTDSWTEQMRRGGLELAILLAVAPGTRYGLEIIRHLQELTDLVVTEGTIYPILGRLTRDGWLQAEWGLHRAPRVLQLDVRPATAC
jgi:PadR family transcriptional regulator PadR